MTMQALQMTPYRHRLGNRVVKYAFLCSIVEMMEKKNASFVWLDEGYESEKDMVHFSSEGHKCILLGAGSPNPEAGTIPLTVLTDWHGQKRQRVVVNLNASSIHIKTLERIAEEVYNRLWDGGIDDEEWDFYRKELVAGFLDTYLYQN